MPGREEQIKFQLSGSRTKKVSLRELKGKQGNHRQGGAQKSNPIKLAANCTPLSCTCMDLTLVSIGKTLITKLRVRSLPRSQTCY